MPRIVLCAVMTLPGFACFMRGGRPAAHGQGASAAAAYEERPARPDESGSLRLFGRPGSSRDVAFETKAATDVRQHTSNSDGVDFDPDIDSSGELLVFASTRHSRYSHLYVKHVGGATLTQITDGPAHDTQPVFAPSGKRIAFTSDRAGHWDVWVIDTNGRSPIQITNSPSVELHPSWSPDGKRLVFCRIGPEGHHGELWIGELDNPGVKRLIGRGLFPAWSPKGDKIAYQRSRARGSRAFSLWTLDIENDEVLFPTEIASRPNVALIAPSWSPDATQLAFACVIPSDDDETPAAPGRSAIGVVDADGRGFHRLTDGRGAHFSPTWSVDGRIYFAAKLAASETIWSIKPFRPAMSAEPAETTDDRRAAAAWETDPDR